MKIDFGGEDEICFSVIKNVGIIKLTRPLALNALSPLMIEALLLALKTWEADNDILCVILEAEGKAFCSGGDVVNVYKTTKRGHIPYNYFSNEYRLNSVIGQFSKPYISLINGIVMGGGAGISLHGSHRIVSENSLFAMPEASLGFFPDVGASYFLTRLSENFGLYLALTGKRIQWGDCVQFGLATHAVLAEDIPHLRKMIIELGNPRPALEKYSIDVDSETCAENRANINNWFGADTLAQCIEILNKKMNEGHRFAKECYESMLRCSPISLNVIWRQMHDCKSLGLDDCLKIENRIAHHMLDNHDFYEGVRATLIDKDQKPVWQPADIVSISDEMIDEYFQPIKEELVL